MADNKIEQVDIAIDEQLLQSFKKLQLSNKETKEDLLPDQIDCVYLTPFGSLDPPHNPTSDSIDIRGDFRVALDVKEAGFIRVLSRRCRKSPDTASYIFIPSEADDRRIKRIVLLPISDDQGHSIDYSDLEPIDNTVYTLQHRSTS
jgi:hypothetical protein